MRTAPAFSVIVPVYNRARMVGSTIASVLEQDSRDFELIIVDDGSTDDTASVVRRFRDERVRYSWKTNGERGAARNHGVRLARGAYINFVDSDDLLYRHHLSTASRFLREHAEPEVFHLGYDVRDPNGKLLRRLDRMPDRINDVLIEGNVLSCNGVFVRADVARSHPFNETRALASSEDYELWLRLASRFPLSCENTVTSTIVEHPGRSVVLGTREALLARLETLMDSLRQDASFMRVYGARYASFASRVLAYGALHLALAGHRRESLRLLAGAVARDPRLLWSRSLLGVLKRNVVSPRACAEASAGTLDDVVETT